MYIEKIIYITNIGMSNKIILLEKKDSWEIVKSIPACIGKNGFTNEKREGDYKTPIGVYNIDCIFGTEYIDVPGFIKTNKKDIWVDDCQSKYYNTWQVKKNGIQYSSYESLYIKQYKYAIAIDYNKECIPYKGSAIFIHVCDTLYSYTRGCVACLEEDLLYILRWLNKNTIIIIEKNTR